MNIYVVTTGEYSDYRVRGVYSTEEKARAAALFFAGNDVDTWVLDAMPPSDCPEGFFAYQVQMDSEGNSTVSRENSSEQLRWPGGSSLGGRRHMVFSVYGRDKTHAVKIASEKRIRLIAEGLWVTGR